MVLKISEALHLPIPCVSTSFSIDSILELFWIVVAPVVSTSTSTDLELASRKRIVSVHGVTQRPLLSVLRG